MKTFRLAGIIILLLVCVKTRAQSAAATQTLARWTSQEPFEQKVFIENAGQFEKEEEELGTTIYYACRTQSAFIFFTKNGFVYRYFVSDYEGEKEENFSEQKSAEKRQEEIKRAALKPYYVRFTWEGTASNTSLHALQQSEVKHVYALPSEKRSIHARGFEKITMHDLYPGIDAEFTMHPKGGIKYNLIIHPGGDYKKIVMKHSGLSSVSLSENSLHYQLKNGEQLQAMSPVAYYSDTHEPVNCSYRLSGNKESFSLAVSNFAHDIVIDPWMVNPNFVGWNRAYDVARDVSGNILAYGGPVPYQLNKYSSTGALIWTFTTPYASQLYGDFAVDGSGNSIFTEGFSGGHVVKIDPNANLIYSTTPTNGGYAEFWRISYNCDYTVLRTSGYIQGTDGNLHQMVDLDPNTGLMLGTSGTVTYESRSLFIDRSGFIYSLSPTQYAGQPNYVTKFTPALALVYAVNSGYSVSEGTGGYINSNYVGCGSCFANMNGVTADANNVYTWDGQRLYKRRNATGAAVDSLTFANGSTLLNSGIVLDACNNLYVGTQNSVVKLDTNLNILASAATPAAVYDLCFSAANNIVAAGDGYVSELNFNTSCNLVVSTAGDSACTGTSTGSATVTVLPQPGDVAPYSYQWSNGATTPVVTGLAPGTYYVIVTDNSCGNPKIKSDSVVIPAIPLPVVTANSATICAGQQSALITAGGAASFTWSPATGLSSTSGNTVTATPSSSQAYTLTGTSSSGCVNTTSFTVTVNTPPVVSATSTSICPGATGTVTAAGAMSYTWNTGSNGASLSQSPASTTSYTVLGVDANGCFDTAVATISVLSTFSVNVNSGSICDGQQSLALNASGASSYSWSPSAGLNSTSTATVSATPSITTTYTVIGSVGSCTAQATAIVTVNPLPTVTVNSASVCPGGTATLTANGAISYSWSPSSSLNASTGASVNAAPASATAYTVIGVDANTCWDTATAYVAIYPQPTITVNSALICAGGTATLSAQGGSSYTWSPSSSLSAANGSTVTAQPTSTTAYTVTSTDINGCAGNAVSTVTVAPNPTITVNNGVICLGQQTATLTASGATSYTWSPATGLSSVSSPTVFATPAASITYTITGALGTCTSVTTAIVTVNALPNVTATSTVVCAGDSGTVTSNGATTYTWSSGVSGNSLTDTPDATSTYTVLGIDNNGCFDTATAQITVNATPPLAVNSPSMCVGSSVALVAGGAVAYSWSPAGGLSSAIGATVTATPSVTAIYTVTGVGANTCSATATSTVTVMSLPVVSAAEVSVCAGGSVALTAAGANSYSWTPVTGLSSSTGATVTATPGANTQYVVSGTDVFGCVNSDTVNVTVNALPLVTVTPAMSSGCAPLCVNFSDTGSAAGTCAWNFGDGNMSPVCSPVHCYTVSGTMTATLAVTDSNNCTSATTATVVVYPVPQAGFYASPQPASVFDPHIYFYDASAGANIVSWDWSFGDPMAGSSQQQNTSFTYADAGSYDVWLTVTSDQGCIDSVRNTVTVDPEFVIYVPNAFTPNGDGGNDVFLAKGEGIGEFELFVYDRWGNKVFHSNDITIGWDGRFMNKGTEVVQQDVYVWKIELRTWKKEPRTLHGTVTLIR